jgi:predicted acetyltransferase
MAEFGRLAGRSLAIDPAVFSGLAADWTLCAFEDGRLATTYAAWPLTMRFNGGAIPIAGVTTVSTDPIYRRRGFLRRIMETDFRRLYDLKQQPLAVLYASQAAIYQRFGYGIVSTHYRYAIEPMYLRFSSRRDVPGRLREVFPAEDFGLLVDIYRRFRERRTGYVHRGRAMWEAGALRAPDRGHVQTVLVYEEDGEAKGYVIYTEGRGGYDGPGPGHVVQVRDLTWLSIKAYRAFWEHFGRMDLVREVVWASVPGDDPLPHLLLEPRMLRAQARDGLLARIVDLAGTVIGRPYPAEAVLRFELVDEMAPWNAGLWEVDTSGEASVRPLSTASASLPGAPVLASRPDLTLDVNTLSMLLFGQVSASQAALMGRLEVHDERALPRWDAALATAFRPFCPDQF